jgi:hypothetical protein
MVSFQPARDLVPIFLECGPELTYHFDLEPRTLEAISNDGLDDPEKKVDDHDIELIVGLHLPGYRQWRTKCINTHR